MRNKSVLITGGTGSLGKELVKKILTQKPKKVIVLSRDEFKQVEMKREVPSARYFIGDIRDRDRLNMAFSGVDIVIHCAAMKHVDICEADPLEAIKTNIHGAENVISAALDCGVKKVLAISTDKAVNPINLYGAAKLCSDKLFLQANNYAKNSGCKFSVLRSGNFIGSRGSVIPFFQSLKDGGADELPITDIRMTRFFISIDDVCNRVLEAINMMNGGEIFNPKMKSINILDLAKQIHPTAKIKQVGIRPGEKLHEDLILSSDKNVIEFENFYVIMPKKTNGRSVKGGFEYRSYPATTNKI